MRRLWTLGLGALLVALLVVAPVQAEVRLSLEQSRVLAIGLVQGGKPAAARAVALMLLRADPADVTALIVLARAARDLGQSDQAIAAGRRAFRLAEGGPDRFAAAMVTAQALSAGDRRGAAQFWLRRAAQVAPDAARRAVAVRDFGYVRSRNPVSAQLSFGATPSSNINGGPTTPTVVIGGFEFINPDAVPLSGVGVNLGASVGYRIDTGPRSHVEIGIAARTTQYVLSSGARIAMPDADAADYATAGLDGSLTWQQASADRAGRVQVSLSGGQDWSGGAVLAQSWSLSGRIDRAISPVTRLGFHLTATSTRRTDEALRSSRQAEAGLRWSRALASGDGLAVTAVLARSWSDAASIAHRSLAVGVDYQVGRPVGGMEVAVVLKVEARDYDRPLYTATPRADLTVEAGVMLTVRAAEFYGFAPQVGVVAARTRSNVAMFDTERIELRLAVKSVF